MKRMIVMVLLVVLLLPAKLRGGAIDVARKATKIYLSVAIRVEAIPTSKIGTGFFTKFERDPSKLIFTTNKHVLSGAKELKLTVPLKDTSGIITKTVDVNVSLFRDTVKKYYTPDKNLDIALLIVDKRSLGKVDKESDIVRFSSLPYNLYCSVENLFVGQSVVFSGYPLGLTVNRTQPLLRNGIIAGIDTIKNIIYLDADAFGGSSGSPVFLDLGTQANAEFLKTYNQLLVGIISKYEPFRKHFRSVQTGKIEMIQTENSGIAAVVPAETIREMADSLLSR